MLGSNCLGQSRVEEVSRGVLSSLHWNSMGTSHELTTAKLHLQVDVGRIVQVESEMPRRTAATQSRHPRAKPKDIGSEPYSGYWGDPQADGGQGMMSFPSGSHLSSQGAAASRPLPSYPVEAGGSTSTLDPVRRSESSIPS